MFTNTTNTIGQLNLLIAGCPCGAGNIGDDAILEGMLKTVRRLDIPGLSITVTSWNPGMTREMFRHYGIKTAHAHRMSRIFLEMARSDAVLVGGGTLVDDSYNGLAFPINDTVRLLRMARWLRKKVFIYAIGVNALHSQRARKLVLKHYGKADIITTRDAQSKKVMEDIGIRDVAVIRDPAFLLDPIDLNDARKMLKMRGIEKEDGRPLIGVSVMNEQMKKVSQYKHELAKACDHFVEKHKAQIVFVAHECREGKDIEAIKETAGYMAHKPLILSKENYHPREMAGMIKCFDLTIGMRMHFMILSAVANVPFIAISRIDKVNNFMQLFDAKPVGSVDDVKAEDIISEAERILGDYPACKQNIEAGMGAILKQSVEAQEMLRGFLR